MATLTGKFVWFEHISRDAARAQRFYGELFSWKVESFPMPGQAYDMIKVGEKGIGGYGRPDDAARWVSYAAVEDVDASLKSITAAGGRVLEPAFDIPNVGRMARVADPLGAELWVMRGTGGPGGDGEAEPKNAPVNTFCWNELLTTDAAAAVRFYEKALGYGHDEMDMGPGGKYHILTHGGLGRAGIMQSDLKSSSWLPYVAVDSCDSAAERAKRGGGTIEVPPTDIPNVGRFTVLRDPLGARLGAIAMIPR